jgi:methyl-accepting chemotaxis protein
MDIEDSIRQHGEWKARFRSVVTRREALDAETIATDDACAVGMRLKGEARLCYHRLPRHGECLARHAAFHREAAKVAAHLHERRFAQAEAALEGSTPYSVASAAVTVALVRLRCEANL